MNFLPQNPKTRNMALIIIAVALTLFVFVFIYIYYFASGENASQDQIIPNSDSMTASEQAIKRIDRDISAIENEMKDDFYKSLRKRVWTPDATAPGNNNPFN